MLTVDVNCDLGEGVGSDADVMQYITSANIACGAHAGDEETMRATLRLAAEHGVAAGAHPGYPDREHFGRHSLRLAPREVYDAVAQQVSALGAIAREMGIALEHVKPHGALYNDAATDANVARSIVRAVHDTDPELRLFGLSGSLLITEAERIGVRGVAEVFADRAYERSGTLTPRGITGAMIEDPATAAGRVLRMLTTGLVRCVDGMDVSVSPETVCIHGDGPHAVAIARELHRTLTAAGVRLSAPGRA